MNHLIAPAFLVFERSAVAVNHIVVIRELVEADYAQRTVRRTDQTRIYTDQGTFEDVETPYLEVLERLTDLSHDLARQP